MMKLAAVPMMLSLLFGSACGTLTQELQQEDAETAEVTTQIKARLVESEDVDAASVLIQLKDNVIILSGFVSSDEEASKAVQITEQEAGEYTVKNELVVK